LNTYGYDGIPTKIIKLSAPFITSPLTHICNQTLSTGIFPERLKYALIRPVFKKGDKCLITNYRPISILTSFSKIVERLIFLRLQRHLNAHQIIAKEQYGFKNKSSTEHAMYHVINEISQAMNKGRPTGGLFCDLEKAFDCVNHEILIVKLKFYGIKGKFLNLIQSFLQGRYLKVLVNSNATYVDAHSKWVEVKQGVPQGSILGPLLFLIYVNDLPLQITLNSKTVLFADDTTNIISSSNLNELKAALCQSLHDLHLWFSANLLSLNINKTGVLYFKNNKSADNSLIIKYMNNTITNGSSVKFLGLLVDDSLCWDNHINYITTKLSSACYALRILTPILSSGTLKMIYYSYAHSIISYGIIFWGSSTSSKKIFLLQKKILRIMTRSKYNESCRRLFKEKGILTLYSQYIFSLVMYVVKNNHLFSKNFEIHSHNTRTSKNCHMPAVNKVKYKKGPLYMASKIYNHLPNYIKCHTNNEKCLKKI
jgi:hypothetical protein